VGDLMLLSHQKKFIYTKAVKVAGTSVESYFERYCMPEGQWELSHGREETVSAVGIVGRRWPKTGDATWHEHQSAANIKRLVGPEVWNTYFKFCCVRNPYEKVVSVYWHHHPKGMVPFREFLLKRPNMPWCQGHQYLINGVPSMDYYVRHEKLEEGLRHVCDAVDVPFDMSLLPNFKSGVRPKVVPFSAYYDSETRAMVAERCKFELEFFGYTFPG
jgi:hypothetical protein